jgi:hypothetical protein
MGQTFYKLAYLLSVIRSVEDFSENESLVADCSEKAHVLSSIGHNSMMDPFTSWCISIVEDGVQIEPGLIYEYASLEAAS